MGGLAYHIYTRIEKLPVLLMPFIFSATLFHPDKVASEMRDSVDKHFVHLKLASETLLDPVKRFAYDRFGPDILEWRHCASHQDYILYGFQRLAPYYLGGVIFMFTLTVLGFLDGGNYVWSSQNPTDPYRT